MASCSSVKLTLSCPAETSTLLSVMNNTNYADQIVKNLEKKGESTDYINGFLQATINGLQHIGDEKILEYMKRSVEHSKQ